ncbi:unnamed protein product [Effrenium voratum]|nr:unnamed protein product [Effrenium voratum]
MGFDETAQRRRSMHELAVGRWRSNHEGCTPSVFLSLAGLAASAVALALGILLFNLQWRRYVVHLGGYMEWNCTLLWCSLRYTYPSYFMKVSLLKWVKQKSKSPDTVSWVDNFYNGTAETFPTLWDLKLCKEKGVRYTLFGNFCHRSTYSGRTFDGPIWGIVKQTSRLGLLLLLLSVATATMVMGWFIVVDHQVLEKVKKPRWQISEERTGQLRILAKVGSGVAPICTVLLVMQYRLCIANFEEAGGVAMQTWLLVLLSSQSKEVQMPWGTLWFLLAGLLQAIVAITALRGPLRKPERPLALDVIETSRWSSSLPPPSPRAPGPSGPPRASRPAAPGAGARASRARLARANGRGGKDSKRKDTKDSKDSRDSGAEPRTNGKPGRRKRCRGKGPCRPSLTQGRRNGRQARGSRSGAPWRRRFLRRWAGRWGSGHRCPF